MAKRKKNIARQKCTYKDFMQLYPFCEKKVQDELMEQLRQQPRPSELCGKEVPENLNHLSYGTLDDIRNASQNTDVVGSVANILLGVEPIELFSEDVNNIFGFATFVTREIERINKLFSDIRTTYSKEEEQAGVRDLDFGSFGVLDWYARRMGITNQNDVRDVAWVRIYMCMKNDNLQTEFERRLQKIYMKKNK